MKIASHKHILAVVKRPKISEKSGIKAESENVYTFEVFRSATKHDIAAAVKEIYKVTPLKVNVVSIPAKKVMRRGKIGYKQAMKKALVFLKKGDKIAFI